jgi:prepilin-type processing-associated H-X9-DG protein
MVSWYRRLSDYSPYRALVTDLIYSAGTVPHPNSTGTAATFNLAFMDGHVTSVQDTYIEAGSTRWPSSATGTMPILDDCIDTLETEADGRNPATEGGDPLMPPMFGYSTSDPYIYRLQHGSGAAPGTSQSYHPLVPWE